MSNLVDKGIVELRKLAKEAGVSAGGSKEEIAKRIEEAGVKAPRMLGEGLKPTPIRKTLKLREKKACTTRKDLEKRMKKRGSSPGEAH